MGYTIRTNTADDVRWSNGAWFASSTTAYPIFYIDNTGSEDVQFNTLSLYYASPNDTAAYGGTGYWNFNNTSTTITYTVANDATNTATITTPGASKIGRLVEYSIGAYPSNRSQYNFTTSGASSYATNGLLIPAVFSKSISIPAGQSVRINCSWESVSGAGIQFFPLAAANISVSHTVWSYHTDGRGWVKDKDVHIYNGSSWVKQGSPHKFNNGSWSS